MSHTRRDLLAGTAGTLALAAVPASLRAQASGDAVATRLLAGIAEQRLRDTPDTATQLGLDVGARADLRSRLEDKSASGQHAIAQHLRDGLSQLRTLKRAALGAGVLTDIAVVEEAYGLALDGFAFPYGDVSVGSYRNSPYVVIQNVGAFLDTPKLLDSDHRIASAADAEAYLTRMRIHAGQLDGETERLRAARGQGVIAPDFLLDKTLRQLRLARGERVEAWPLVTGLATRARAYPGDWAGRASAVARDGIAPALERQITELELHRARAKSDAGVWALPRGEAYYAWALRAGTTTRMTPEEVHAMGRDELRAIEGRMDPILRTLGYTQGSVGARMTALARDPRFTYPDDDAGRERIMSTMRERLAGIRALMPRAFHTLVRGDVEVRRLPLAEEPGAPGAYGGAGSIDGSLPSRVWLNLRTTRLHTSFSLPTLAYHEGIPGHGWQGEYTLRQPLIRTLLRFNAYNEGWGLYAEQLADELSVYDDDPVGRLGYLQGQAYRAARLTIDTGLHAKRWTRARAIDYFATATGQGPDEVTGEVDRYCAWPGQACGYKIGHTHLNALRDRMRRALGARFDGKAFNDAVVSSGNMPLTVLDAVVERRLTGA